ncbi:transcriptional regulator [Rhodococcus sp. 05-2255-3B1]|uniref:helix-turn-helix domain-containing protein n=1 Tax=unclassified Rhodococcus (in: high G+C Gram-positive bacteria) TaxID=192944 RepID=UPI000B9BAA0F|nr:MULTISPECIES: helix-turn-helix transcriptional regulator [unclassified Rhodococcus (in: high G+C Gram-positive bacteria)]OZE15684.1 transcriptional regulator [Rhodococcus sp. 05-2255-3B1]OZE16431.1 transcriptional regulator [Rhodococcus sp. 05-2255-3C]OZE21406.1 transcriptional regulator [Rhodococcus sp. 05-2255-2A2]
MNKDRSALSAFLRDRRDRMTPIEAGIRTYPGARRVPGLRREELAALAGVSPDYYSKLEQGRQANVSNEVLLAIAGALKLDDVESAHLLDLASPATPTEDAAQVPNPGLLQVMKALDHVPVILLGRSGAVLASNSLVRSVLSLQPSADQSLFHYLFRNPIARERIVNWSQFAAASVAGLRRDLARRPGDRALTALIDELRSAEPCFEQWWSDHEVREFERATKIIQHPAAGTLEFGIEFLTSPSEPDQSLIVYTVEDGSSTAEILPILASWDPSSAIRT